MGPSVGLHPALLVLQEVPGMGDNDRIKPSRVQMAGNVRWKHIRVRWRNDRIRSTNFETTGFQLLRFHYLAFTAPPKTNREFQMPTTASRKMVPLRRKLLLVIGASALLIVGAIIVYNTLRMREQSMRYSQDHVTALARDYASQIKGEIEKALNVSRDLAFALSAAKDPALQVPFTRSQVNVMIRQILIGSDNISGIFVVFEPNAFDGLDLHYATLSDSDTLIPYAESMDSVGHFVPYWFKENGRIIVEPTYAYGKAWYELPRSTRRELVLDPQMYIVQEKSVLLMTLEVPILFDNVFYGLVGVDISVDWLKEKVNNAHLYDSKTLISIIANDGTIAAFSGMDTLVGKKLLASFPERQYQMDDLKAGKEGTFFDHAFLQIYVPILLGTSEVPWQINVEVPAHLITVAATSQMWRSIFISTGLLIVALLVIFFFVGRLIKPLNQMVAYTKRMAEGRLEEDGKKAGNDELGEMREALNFLADHLKQTSSFAEQIGKGHLDAEFSPAGEKDVLGNSLLEMRSNLQAIAREDEKQNWVTNGQALFVDILSQDDMGSDEVAFRIIKELVGYLGANQGAIFFRDSGAENEQKPLYMAASYAWNKRKFSTLRLAEGEGLAGQCFVEGKTIYMTEVPDHYIRITSGIGMALPRAVLVVPMLINGTVKGVTELASFNAFEQHHIEFVEKIGESIALTFSNIETNRKTRQLLDQSHKARKALQVREEELRQNQEELRATHEELDRMTRRLKSENEELKRRLGEAEPNSGGGIAGQEV